MAKYYLDTSIWRDYYENRSDKFRPLGEWAHAFLEKAILEKSTLLFSALVIRELNTDYSAEMITHIFDFARHILKRVEISSQQSREAQALGTRKHIPFPDALHAILSRDNNAIIITRDRHFEELQDIVEVKKPEDLI